MLMVRLHGPFKERAHAVGDDGAHLGPRSANCQEGAELEGSPGFGAISTS